MCHKPLCRSIVGCQVAAGIGAALLGVAACQMAPALAATTAPATQSTSRPTTQQTLPRISLRGIGLLGEVDISVTSDGIYSYASRDNSGPTKSKTFALNPAQITKLANAVRETLDRPSRPQRVTDHYEKLTIGKQTWESNDIDDKFQPLHEALFQLEPKD